MNWLRIILFITTRTHDIRSITLFTSTSTPTLHSANFLHVFEKSFCVSATCSNTHLRPLIEHHDMKRALENLNSIA